MTYKILACSDQQDDSYKAANDLAYYVHGEVIPAAARNGVTLTDLRANYNPDELTFTLRTRASIADWINQHATATCDFYTVTNVQYRIKLMETTAKAKGIQVNVGGQTATLEVDKFSLKSDAQIKLAVQTHLTKHNMSAVDVRALSDSDTTVGIAKFKVDLKFEENHGFKDFAAASAVPIPNEGNALLVWGQALCVMHTMHGRCGKSTDPAADPRFVCSCPMARGGKSKAEKKHDRSSYAARHAKAQRQGSSSTANALPPLLGAAGPPAE